MDSSKLENYRSQLQDKRDDLLHRVRSARSTDAETTDAETPDLGDRATNTMSKDLLYQLTTGEREILKRIDLALKRFDDGHFGECDHCSKPVQSGRLDAVPWALHCIECQELQDRGEI